MHHKRLVKIMLIYYDLNCLQAVNLKTSVPPRLLSQVFFFFNHCVIVVQEREKERDNFLEHNPKLFCWNNFIMIFFILYVVILLFSVPLKEPKRCIG